MKRVPGIAAVLCTIPGTGTTYVAQALDRAGVPATGMHTYRDALRKPSRLDSLRRFAEENRTVVCVTLVREPLAIVISQTFWSFYNQRLDQGAPWFDEQEPTAADLDRFRGIFHDVHYPNYRDGRLEAYFGTEFREGMGIDVFASAFPHTTGYAVFDRDPAAPGNPVGANCHHLVVLRTDRIEEQLRPALIEATGGRPVPELRFSVEAVEARAKGASNKDKPYYARFVRNLGLTDVQIGAFYGTGYARHFLAKPERKSLTRSWITRLRET